MKSFALIALILTGCIQSELVPCGDLECPADATCHQGACVTTQALAACAGISNNTPCVFGATSNALCLDEVCVAVGCGTGVIDPRSHEVCADTNRESGDGCNADCTSNETCGNGVVDSNKGEACDDGNIDDNDSCHHDCLQPRCGDGITDTRFFEACDDGLANSDAADAHCRSNCLLARCGDGIKDPHETCDDGNSVSGDGCSFDCKSSETCGNGYVDYARDEQCDNDLTLAADGCGQICELESTVSEALPNAPNNYAMCGTEDPNRREFVVFDGSKTRVLGRLGLSLRHVPHTPPPPSYCAMTYDSAAQAVVMATFNVASLRSELWKFDGSDWTLLNDQGPARNGANLIYDPDHNQFLFYGGKLNDVEQFDTWTFQNGTWTALPTAGTSPNGAALAVWSSNEHRILAVTSSGVTFHFANNHWVDETSPVCTFDPVTMIGTCTLGIQLPPRDGGALANAAGTVIIGGGNDCFFFQCTPAYSTYVRQNGTWISAQFLLPEIARFAVHAANGRTQIFDSSFTVDTSVIVDRAPSGDPVSADVVDIASPAYRNVSATYVPALAATLHWGGDYFGGDYFESSFFAWYSNGNGRRVAPLLPGQPCQAATTMALDDIRVALACGGNVYYLEPDRIEMGPPMLGIGSTLVWDPTKQVLITWNDDHLEQLQGTTWSAVPNSAGLPTGVDNQRLVTWRGSIYAAWNTTVGNLAQLTASGWVPIDTTAIAATFTNVIVDPIRQRIVATLGSGALLWAYDGSRWTRQPYSGEQFVPQTFDARNAMLVDGQNSPRHGIGVRSLDANRQREVCELATADTDADGKAGCADPDCWWRCDPGCAPNAPASTCSSSRPRCGDSVCNAPLENPAICPSDCAVYTPGW